LDIWAYSLELDTEIGNTCIISNQAGYPGENINDFDPKFIIEI